MAELIISGNDFKALSSEVRVHIIKLLASRNHNLTELSSRLKLSMPSVKQHIDVLLATDLIVQADAGHKWKYYSLSRKGKKLVEPYSSQVMIVLASFIVGVLGIAMIAYSLLGFQALGISSTSLSTSQGIIAENTVASEALGAVAKDAVGAGGVQEALNASSGVQAFAGLPSWLFLVIGVLVLAFAFLLFKRKLALFR